MKLIFTLSLVFTFYLGQSQQLNLRYRTVIEEHLPLHYIIFTDKEKCQLLYPIKNHTGAMISQKRDFSLNYKVMRDTLKFSFIPTDSINSLIKHFTESTFVIRNDGTIYNCTSGNIYLDDKLVSDKFSIYVFDGEIFKQKNPKMNGYGLIEKEYEGNRKMKSKIKSIDINEYTFNILKGSTAYEKYGVIGMNGVIEIEKKD